MPRRNALTSRRRPQRARIQFQRLSVLHAPARRRASAASRPTGRASRAPPGAGSIRRVFRRCQPTLFSVLNPVSIQKRISRHDAPASAGGRSVRIIHGSSCPSSQMTIIVPRRRFDLALNAIPLPMMELPGAENGLRAGIRLPPSRRNVVFMRRRMYGCQPNERIFFHRFGLLSPRFVIAIARISEGMATDKRIERIACGFYPLARFVGGHDDSATGMAHPR